MKAIVIHAAHDLRVEHRPTADLGPGLVRIDVASGGVCGSDLHYFHRGGFGAIRLREPMVLGHEVSGTVTALGEGVDTVRIGDRVAISPAVPCGQCSYCLSGLSNHCLDMRFYGSAMRFPHVDGAFRQDLIARASQCHRLDDDVSHAEGTFAEPLAVALHATARAGSLLGKRVIVTGSGPIGALCVLSARAHGARRVTVTDVLDPPLAYSRMVGADETLNVASDPERLADLGANKGTFDVMFEASGNASALASGLSVLKPRGVLVQLGLGGDVSLAQNLVVAKEIDMRGSFRFIDEFALAVDLINSRRVDVRPLLSATYPLRDAAAAFEAAGDRTRSMKVQIDFADA